MKTGLAFTDAVVERVVRVGYRFNGLMRPSLGQGCIYTYVGEPDSELLVFHSGMIRLIEEHRDIDRFLVRVETDEELTDWLGGTYLGALLFRHKLGVLLDVIATPG